MAALPEKVVLRELLSLAESCDHITGFVGTSTGVPLVALPCRFASFRLVEN